MACLPNSRQSKRSHNFLTCGSRFSKQIRNAAHETDPIPTQTALICRGEVTSPLRAVYSNWTYSHPSQLLLDYLH